MTIGSTLKEARTRKELSLEDIHTKIKIHPRILQLLEEEKFDRLPSPLFAKSFLRSYAQFLEVNAEELLQDYEKEKKQTEVPEQVLYLKPASLAAAPKIPLSWWAGGTAVALLFGVALFGVPARFAATFTPKPKKAVTAKAEKTVKAVKEKAVETAAEDRAPDWILSPKLGNFPSLSKKTPLELEIRALDAVWVHITCDGKVLYQGVMKKGAQESWLAKAQIEIWTGNASNMLVSLNKTPLGSPGKGIAKKMLLSHEGIRIASPIGSA